MDKDKPYVKLSTNSQAEVINELIDMLYDEFPSDATKTRIKEVLDENGVDWE